MTAEPDLLPLPKGNAPGCHYLAGQVQSYARANVAPLQAENERLAEALRKIAALTEEFDDLDDAVGIANEALERENDDAARTS